MTIKRYVDGKVPEFPLLGARARSLMDLDGPFYEFDGLDLEIKEEVGGNIEP
jgi:hypothetical protein